MDDFTGHGEDSRCQSSRQTTWILCGTPFTKNGNVKTDIPRAHAHSVNLISPDDFSQGLVTGLVGQIRFFASDRRPYSRDVVICSGLLLA